MSPIDWSRIGDEPFEPSPWQVWIEKFACLATWEEGSELYRRAREDPELSPDNLRFLVNVGKSALRFVPRGD